MRKAPDRLFAVLGLAALALSALVVSPSPPEGRILARAEAAGPLAALAMELLFALASGAGILLIGVLAFLRLAEIRSGEDGAGRRRSRPWVAYALFLVVLVASPGALRRCSLAFPEGEAARAAQPSGEAGPAAAPAPSPGGAASEALPEPEAPLSLPLFALAALAGALALGAALYFGVHGRGADRAHGGGDAAAAAAAARSEGLAALRRRLELGDEVRDAIVAAYAEMCELFADRALARGRDPGRLTAREFAALLREALGPGAAGTEAEIEALTAAFEKARYSNEACGEEDRSRAVRALRALEAAGGRA